MSRAHSPESAESGFVLVIVVTLLIPVMMAVAAFSTVMMTRGSELRTEHDEELALLTAEAGVDEAIYRARVGLLNPGVVVTRSLGTSRFFTTTPTYLKTDGKDNDADGNIDEADEDVYQIVSVGTYRNTSRRIAAYVGITPLPPKFGSALSTLDTDIVVDNNGTMSFDGRNYRMDGSLVGTGDTYGLAIAPPGTVAYLQSELNALEAPLVKGLGGAPSLGLSDPVDLTAMVDAVINSANLVLTSNLYADYQFGNGALGVTNVAYRNGNVTFGGISQGAGILLVTGDLVVTGDWRFDGVVIVLGQVRATGTAKVYGAMLQGPSGGALWCRGTFDTYYSEEAIALASELGGTAVSFNGWQEISRQ